MFFFSIFHLWSIQQDCIVANYVLSLFPSPAASHSAMFLVFIAQLLISTSAVFVNTINLNYFSNFCRIAPSNIYQKKSIWQHSERGGESQCDNIAGWWSGIWRSFFCRTPNIKNSKHWQVWSSFTIVW